MKILLINSNENRDITKRMMKIAEKVAHVSTQIEGINASSGVPVVKTPEDIDKAAEATYDTILANEEKYDAFIIACFSDPGLWKARRDCKKPVLGMAESCMFYAGMRGLKFVVITGEEKMCPAIEKQVKEYGLWERCSGVIAVDAGYVETFLKKEELYPLYLEKIKDYQKEHRVDVLCLGGAVFTDWKEQLEKDLGIPVMEGVEMAVKAAQDM